MSGILLRVDTRRRISLGDLAHHDLYLADVDDVGRIVLTPATVAPAIPPTTDVDRFLEAPAGQSIRVRPQRSPR